LATFCVYLLREGQVEHSDRGCPATRGSIMRWFERLNDSRPERVSRSTLVMTTILTRGTLAALLAMVGVAGLLLRSPDKPEDQSTDFSVLFAGDEGAFRWG
jgi:hypothetical protein